MTASLPPEERDALTRRIAADVKRGKNVRLHAFVHLYGCEIGHETSIRTCVEIQKGVRVGGGVACERLCPL